MINKNLLKSKMALHEDDQNALAAALGITIQRLSAKMNAKQVSEKVKPAAFTLQEVGIIMQRYKLTPDEVVQIFLPDMWDSYIISKTPQSDSPQGHLSM